MTSTTGVDAETWQDHPDRRSFPPCGGRLGWGERSENHPHLCPPPSRGRSGSGFTLIEVMMAVAILSLATVTISQSNLMNLNVYGRFANRMAIQNWAESKMWEAKEKIFTSEIPEAAERSGVYESEDRTYQWRLSVSEVSSEDLYAILLRVNWNDTGREVSLERFSYVYRPKDPK